MNSLPQRKKSAEEIAKLREAMGIPGQEAVADDIAISGSPLEEAPKQQDPAGIATEQPSPRPLPITLPNASAGSVRPVRSLKRSELAVESSAVESDLLEAAPDPLPERKRIVRSLRKSEQVPIVLSENHTPPANSDLPVHRHSDKELDRIRRQGLIQMQGAAVEPQSQIAHLLLVVPGYMFALGGAVSFYFYDLSIYITAGAALIAAMIAGFIFFKKPFSRYHSAFIAVIVLFVIVFGMLHYFPPLQDGP